MRIKKTSQYIEGGASLSNVYGTSNENGYTQSYINNMNTFSNDEVRIGTYNNKPLYRKIVSATFGTVTEGTQSELVVTMNGVDFALVDKYWLDRMDENNPAINQGYAPDVMYLGYTSFSDGNCYLRFRTKVAFASSKKVYAIVLYTKTTDTTQNTRSISNDNNDEVEEEDNR